MADETSLPGGDGAGDRRESAPNRLRRRTLLRGTAAATVGLAGCARFLGGGAGDETSDSDGSGDGGNDEQSPSPPTRETESLPGDDARALAERFAPTLYFGEREKWYPTDPRPYTTERDGETVVNGFDAFDGYTAEMKETDSPPAPTVFYHAVSYDERLTAIQYWFYSVFDQFTTNFHWHDWEVLHVFVDRTADEPVLYVASAHSPSVPNNEFLDPPTTPAIISEVGSHSSALGVNERRDTFQRVSIDGLFADVTNAVVTSIVGGDGIPFAYGLPRDEGFRLPYVVPELDGTPIYDHPKLPNVERDDLVPDDVTVRSFTDLLRPPTGLPGRRTGLAFGPDHRDDDADVSYALEPTSTVEEITEFTGPQLSFEFTIPTYAENAIATHLTTTSAPWTQSRYDDPIADITDDRHLRVLRERFRVESGTTGEVVVGQVQEVTAADDTVDGAGVTLTEPTVEAVCLLESDPVAVPTFGGVAAFVGVEPGEHRLTVNGAGVAPYAQTVRVGDGGNGGDEPGPVRVGSEGTIGLVPNENAVKFEIDVRERGGPKRIRVEDDVGGTVFDAPPAESEGRAAVYAHRNGAYVVEVTDANGGVSVERVRPGPNDNAVEVAKARTGTSGTTTFLVRYLRETRTTVRRLLGEEREAEEETTATSEGSKETTVSTSDGEEDRSNSEPTRTATPTTTATTTPTSDAPAAETVLSLLDEAIELAEQADKAATAGETARATEVLRALRSRLDRLRTLADERSSSLPRNVQQVLRQRVEAVDRRVVQALERAG